MNHSAFHKTSYTWYLLLLLFVAGFAYSPTVKNDFIWWDDPQVVMANADTESLSVVNIVKMFTKSYVSMYQPLVTLSFAIERALFGVDPFWFHLDNLLLHLANIILVYLVVLRILSHQPTALFAAVIFALHPMHVESVAWVTERKDVLYAFFYFLALLAFLRSRHNKRFYFLSLSLYTLSLLSKSAAVTFPLLLLLLHWYEHRQWQWDTLKVYLPFFGLAVLFGIISIITQKPQDNTAFFATYTFFDRIFLSLYPVAFYAVKYFLPLGLCVFHPLPPKVDGFLPWTYYVAPAVVAFLVYLLFQRWNIQRTVRFALAFFFLHILLYLHFFPVGSAVVAERYTYIAYIGLSIFCAQVFFALKERFAFLRYIQSPLLLLITLSLAFLSYNRVPYWNNTIVLFDDAVKKTGLNETSGNMLCLGYLSEGRQKLASSDTLEALKYFETAITFDPTYYGGYEQRGRLLFKQKRYSEALQDFSKALANTPAEVEMKEVYELRGLAYLRLKQYEQAYKDFSTAILLDSLFARAYANRGVAAWHIGKKEEACSDFHKARVLDFTQAQLLIDEYCISGGKRK